MQRRTLLAALPAALAWTSARAQAFPSRQIRYIVPVAAGGGSDLVGRTVTERWGRLLNQSFVVDNIGGTQTGKAPVGRAASVKLWTNPATNRIYAVVAAGAYGVSVVDMTARLVNGQLLNQTRDLVAHCVHASHG